MELLDAIKKISEGKGSELSLSDLQQLHKLQYAVVTVGEFDVEVELTTQGVGLLGTMTESIVDVRLREALKKVSGGTSGAAAQAIVRLIGDFTPARGYTTERTPWSFFCALFTAKMNAGSAPYNAFKAAARSFLEHWEDSDPNNLFSGAGEALRALLVEVQPLGFDRLHKAIMNAFPKSKK